MKIKINDQTIYQFAYGGLDAKETILPKLFSVVPNLQYWSEDGLRKLFVGSLEFVIEFLRGVNAEISEDLKLKSKSWHHRELAKQIKRKHSNFIRKLESQLRLSPRLDRNGLLRQLYGTVLSCDGLETLRNFGIVNQFGDKIMGNPERQSILKKFK